MLERSYSDTINSKDIVFAKSYFYTNCTGIYILLLLFTVLRGQRAKPIIVDPGLYMTKKKDIYWAGPERELPTAFKLFTGTNFSIQTIKLETIQ